MTRVLAISTILLFALPLGCSSSNPTPASTPATTPASQAKPQQALPPAEDAPTGYRVKFERPVTAGYKYRLTSAGKRTVELKAAGKPAPGSGTLSWDYAAVVTVKAVGPLGRPKAESHEVVKFDVTFGGMTKSPIEKGTIISAAVVNERETFTVKGKPVDELVSEILQSTTELDDGGEMNRDVVFGAAQPKQVGESWSVDKQKLVNSFADTFTDSPLPLKVENTSGTVTLTGIEQVKGIEAMRVKAKVDMKNVAPNLGEVELDSGNIQLTLNVWLPVDTTSVAGEGSTRTMKVHTEGKVETTPIAIDIIQEITNTKLALKR